MEPGLADGIDAFAKAFDAENDAILQDATSRVIASIVKINPVRTGADVADWDIAVGSWPSNEDHGVDPKKSATRQRLQATLTSVKFGQIIYLENDDPAAVRLEHGWSKQAPQGVVRLTIRKWNSFVRGAGIAAQNRASNAVGGGFGFTRYVSPSAG